MRHLIFILFSTAILCYFLFGVSNLTFGKINYPGPLLFPTIFLLGFFIVSLFIVINKR